MMRLLLVGAFPYPHPQGSQVYFQEQAIALRSAGAEVSLLSYGSAQNGVFPGQRRAAELGRALDGFEHRTSAQWTWPGSLRSGPSWAKPLADLGLAMTLRNAIASRKRHDAYDAILTHNSEAALIALHTLPSARPPVVYCAHTLLANELSAYSKGGKMNRFSSSWMASAGTGPMLRSLDRLGGGIDRWISQRVDGWIALTQSCERVMRQFSRKQGALIPPPLADPELAPEPLDPVAVARRHALEPGGFFLYSGNLDGYQELDILAAAAAELARRSDSPPRIVIASHSGSDSLPRKLLGPRSDRSPQRGDSQPGAAAEKWAASRPGIEFLQVGSAREMLALLSAARASLVMRRAQGGFPIKLVNSLAVGTPVVSFYEQEWGLTHNRNSLICALERPAPTLADAIERLAADAGLATRLAAGARALYQERHRPEDVASKTLALLREVGCCRRR